MSCAGKRFAFDEQRQVQAILFVRRHRMVCQVVIFIGVTGIIYLILTFLLWVVLRFRSGFLPAADYLFWFWPVHWIVIAVLGGALASIGPEWLATQSLPQGFCERCGYDLRGSSNSRCPECGTEF